MTVRRRIVRRFEKISVGRAHEVIRRPLITEKATRALEQGHVVFEVALNSIKPEIKQAVEKLFSVDVRSVNTLRQDGKRKRFRGRMGRRRNFKKAYVCLAKGQTIDIGSGL